MAVMPADAETINLTHHFLIAMPGLQDEAFAKSVIYLCEHSSRGALGLVINKPDVLGFCMIGLQVTDQSIAFNDAGGVISGGDTQFLILNVVKHNP